MQPLTIGTSFFVLAALIHSATIIHLALRERLANRAFLPPIRGSARNAIALLGSTLFLANIVTGQTLPAPTAEEQLGDQAYQSYHGGDIDHINLTSGILNLNMPFLEYPQRGKLHLSFNLTYDTAPQHFGQFCVSVDGHQTCEFLWGYSPVPLFFETGDVQVSWAQAVALLGVDMSVPGEGSTTWYANWSLFTADGAKHPLGNLGTQTLTGQSPTLYWVANGPFETLDATGWRVNGALTPGTETWVSGTAQIIGPDGVTYGNSGTQQDPNGNKITTTTATITDSLGRQVPSPPTVSSSQRTSTSVCPVVNGVTASYAVPWTVPAYGGSATYSFCYGSTAVNIPTGYVDGYYVYGGNGPGSETKLQSIVLPNGQSWQFEYNDPDGTNYDNAAVNYATLSQVTLPTGGTISYTYQYGVGCGVGNSGGRWISTRTVTDNTGSHTWTYTYNTGSTTVTDPLGNAVVHTFGFTVGDCGFYETQAQYYSGSQSTGTLLRTVATTYSGNTSVDTAPYGGINVVPTSVSTVWPNGETKEITKSYDSGFSFIDFNGASDSGIYGKVTSETAYDYGSGAKGSALRTTNTVYAWQSPSPNYASYLANNLVDLRYSVQTQDGSGTQRAYTYYGYDETSLQSSGISEQKVTGEAHPGNQTSTHRWLNSSTTATSDCNVSISNGYVTSNKVYYNTGEVQQSTDPCGKSTTLQYSSSYYGAFLTTSTNVLSQSTSYAYDFNTGAVTSITDPNNQPTTKSYDILTRPTQVNYPDGGSTSYCYTDSGGPTCTKAGAPYEVVIARAITSSPVLNETSTIIFDGFGRVSQAQLNSDPSCTTGDITATTYDGLGRISTVSNPYCTTSDPTYGLTTYTYDALGQVTRLTHPDNTYISTSYGGPSGYGRATSVSDEGNGTHNVQRISQVDGLGRMTSVCEITSTSLVGITPNPGPCDMDITPATGFVTSYSYDALNDLTGVTQGGLNPRSFVYDSLSRLTSALNPETGTTPNCNGTCYAYDANGNLITRTAPKENQTGTATVTTTYTYDALNRLTSKTYSDGTPSVGYYYDQPSPWGLGQYEHNYIGRLTETEVFQGQNNLAGSVNSYDPMGRTAYQWQCTPLDCGTSATYFAYTYDLIGDLASSYNNTDNITYTNTYNGAAELASLQSSPSNSQHPGTLVTLGDFNAFQEPQQIAFGNGITECLSYNTREQMYAMNQTAPGQLPPCDGGIYGYNILSPSSTTGYAPNGDILYANDSANGNWSYTYDDFNRLVSGKCALNSLSCPVASGFTYTYDRFGNRHEEIVTAGSGVEPDYIFNANNQVVGNNTYDAAGNVIYDGLGLGNTYTYDAENRIISASNGYTASYVYDAFGHRVRSAVNGQIRDFLYDLRGRTIDQITAGTLTRSEAYAGDRHVATYVNSTTEFDNSDWLSTFVRAPTFRAATLKPAPVCRLVRI